MFQVIINEHTFNLASTNFIHLNGHSLRLVFIMIRAGSYVDRYIMIVRFDYCNIVLSRNVFQGYPKSYEFLLTKTTLITEMAIVLDTHD
jgi:hypothetical protein